LYLRKIYTPEQSDLLNNWLTIAKNAFWWYPYENICFVCDRPEQIHKNARGQLHNPDGPAVLFSDGWAVWYINGVSVPSWIITNPEQITPDIISAESNAEVRRIMIGIYGWHNYLDRVNARMIDQHENPELGELWEWTDADGVRVQIVRVRNGTPEMDGTYKWYSLRVRPQFDNVVDAVASTYPGISRDEFFEMSKFRT
jgi:hypothetical protein